MKEIKNILLLLIALFTLGCSQTIIFEDIQTPTPTPTPKPEPDLDTSSYIDLSAEGTANCYLVKAAGKYKLKAVKGNSTQSVGAASSADVLWESFGTSTKPNEGDLIASATYKDGYVYFATPTTFKSGNASIAVRDSKAKILWSWHIWLSKEGWKDDIYPNNAGTMMDRNLGATSATPGSVGAFGLLYQWGRKDPFLGSSSISSNTLAKSTGSWSSVYNTQQTVDYVTANPMTFVCESDDWCTGDGAKDSNYAKRWTESIKSMYDPCPVGYRVPEGGRNDGFWATALGTSDYTNIGTTWDSTNKGRHWTLSDGTTAWYPAVGCRRTDSEAMVNVGSDGYCWSASPGSSSISACHLLFNKAYVYPRYSLIRSSGYSVRCVSTTATSNPNPEPEIDFSTATDLSAEGTANCYLVKAAGKYKLKAVKGNSTQSVGAASSADVLWESFGTSSKPNEGDLIASATYKDGYVYFATPNTFKSGNASIAVRDSNAKILWSWHIWCSAEGWKDDVYPNNAGTMMDRNLGATSATPGSVGALGLMYQWGRKDPFLGSSSISRSTLAVSTGSWSSVYNTQRTVDYVTANPMIFVGKYGDWCTGDGAEDSNYAKRWTESAKSMYDPCPVGYRVPDGGSNGFWATALGTSSKTSTGTKWDSTNCGCHWTLADGESTAWYPVVGSRSYDSALYYVGSDGNYWSASPHPSDSEYACYLLFYDGNVYPVNRNYRGYGQSVRCVSTTAPSNPNPEPEIDFSTATDLSAAGTANCYIVSEEGTYKFKPVKGNSSISVGAISSVVVLWESFGTATTPNVGDIVSTVDYKDGYIAFKTANSFNEGNALIAAKDASDRILWSWHIWFTDQPVEQVYYNNAGTMMDRNLGATSATPGSVGALGLMYQWGRKDPFLGSSSISSGTEAKSTITFPLAVASNSTTGTIEYATANPTTYITGVGGLDSNEDWYYTGTTLTDNTRWTESGSNKSIYDPCPVGWRVPDGGENGVWSKALGSSASFTSSFDYTNKGIIFSGKFGEASTIWYPAVGYRDRDSGALMLDGSCGNYWTSSPHPNYVSGIYKFCFYNEYVHLMSIDSRGLSCSVRCVSATATSNPKPEPEPTKGYIVPENAKRVTFEIDGSLKAYTNVADQFNIADLVKGANTNATVQMAYLNDNDLLAWQDWTITDGWFGLNGATYWGNGNIACVKPKTDGSFEYVGFMDGQAIGTKATAIFDYGNDIIVAITVEIVAPEVSNVVYSENCGSTISEVDGYWPYVDMYTGWSRQGGNGCDQSGVTYTGVNASVRDNGAEYKPDSGASYASDAPYAYISYKTDSNFGINNIKIDSSTKSYSLSFTAHNQYACLISSPYTPATTPLISGKHVKLYVSVDGQNWGVVQFATVANGNWEYATAPFTLPTNADTLHIKFADLSIGTLSLPSTEYQHVASLRLDDFCLTKGGNGPTLNFDHTFGEQPTPEPTEPANNEIWYTSTDGAVIAHRSGSVSGANIVSNTYTNGKGVLTFDGNVTKILSNLFSAKSKLKSIVLPNSVTHIYTQAFGNCYNLVDVDLGSGLTYIGNAAFDACRALTSITIPDSVTFIGPAPFLACYNLANFYGAAATDDHKGLVIDNTFVSFAPAGPTEYSIPHGVTVIQDGSFNDCQKITKVTIPATVVEIEEQAFYRCYALSVVNCLPTTPPTLLMHSSYGTFDSNASDRKIYVPASSVSAYKSASGWSTYADAIIAIPNGLTFAPYAVGDYYNDGTKEGVVFEVSADGTSGKIVSMMRSSGTVQWSSDETEQKRLIGADSETDGAYNTAKVKAISGWETKYPAFKWCADLGDGWYLPAKEELLTIYNNKDKLNTNLTDKLSSYYWSSTESDYQYSGGVLSAWDVSMDYGSTYRISKDGSKTTVDYVRAAATFGDTPKPKTYAVGDYYNDGTKEGVVFEVSADGTSGKIVSMMQSTGKFQWSSDKTEQKRLIGAYSETDGAYNTGKVKAISGWETKYPAFKWCADLGDGWYMPAKEELLTIYNNKDKLNTNLTDKLSSGFYWSSTEDDYQLDVGYFCAWDVGMYNGYTYNDSKHTTNYVRAVSAF